MLFSEIVVTKEGYQKFGEELEKALRESESKECEYYYSDLKRISETAFDCQNQEKYSFFWFFSGLASMLLRPENKAGPYQPMFIIGDNRSPMPLDLSEAQLDFLLEILPELKDAELKARIADILYLRRKGDYQVAQDAIESYFASARRLQDPEHWSAGFKRIERALRLAASLGKSNASFKSAITTIKEILQEHNGEDPLYFSAKLIALLIEYGESDVVKHAEILNKQIQLAETQQAYFRAKDLCLTKAELYKANKEDEQAVLSRKEAAEMVVKAAKRREADSFLAASMILMQAIDAYRQIPGSKPRVEVLHTTLIGYQRLATSEMESHTIEFDFQQVVENSLSAVKGKSLPDVFIELAKLMKPIKSDFLQQSAENAIQNYPIQYLVNSTKITLDGKVQGVRPALIYDDPEEVRKSVKAEMYKQAHYHHLVCAVGVIKPIINYINANFEITPKDFDGLLLGNPFVPPGRESFYAKGLFAGLENDFMSSAHLLIPQLENSIRYILQKKDVITSGLDSEGIQDEGSLNKTLYCLEIKDILSEDMVVDLQGLLVERLGANLRNRLAHGLMEADEFEAAEAIYLWGITIYLLFLSLSKAKLNNAQGNSM